MSSEPVTLTLTREQARWLLNEMTATAAIERPKLDHIYFQPNYDRIKRNADFADAIAEQLRAQEGVGE